MNNFFFILDYIVLYGCKHAENSSEEQTAVTDAATDQNRTADTQKKAELH